MKSGGLALSFLLLAPSAEAGPWTMGKGRFYTKLSFQHLRATELAQPDGTLYDIPRFTRSEVGFYGIVGLTDRLDVYTSLPIVRSADLRDEPDELARESGFGDAQVGAQAQLGRKGPWVFAARGTLQFPTGDVSRGQGLLPTGSGAWEGEAVVGTGLSFARGKGYGYVELGHQFRGRGLRDGFVYNLQLGWNAAPRLTLAVNLRGVEPWSQSPGDRTAGSYVGLGDRTTYAVLGPAVMLRLSRDLGLQIDYDRAFRARNLARGPALRAGLTLSR